MKLKNKFYIMRHGQAISNTKNLCSCWPEKFHNPLTSLGKKMVEESIEKFEEPTGRPGKRIDLIFCSPLLRAKMTAEIVGKKLQIKPKVDKRLREIGFGIFNNHQLEGMWKYFKSEGERIRKAPPKGETYIEILNRMTGVVKDCEKKYKGKVILLVSHEGPLFLLQGKINGLSFEKNIKQNPPEKRIHKAEIRELN